MFISVTTNFADIEDLLKSGENLDLSAIALTPPSSDQNSPLSTPPQSDTSAPSSPVFDDMDGKRHTRH